MGYPIDGTKNKAVIKETKTNKQTNAAKWATAMIEQGRELSLSLRQSLVPGTDVVEEENQVDL